ncbi:MAG: hypothetical protein IKP40_03140 [Clostridia bacterium]|nr:hypothetical protein [Clostridia bacterium]
MADTKKPGILSDPQNRRHFIIFLVAAVVAVTAFSTGVVSLNHRDAGYYEVVPLDEQNALLFDAGISLLYYAEGSSADIRETLGLAQKAYTAALYNAYRLLNPDTVWEDVTNLAAISRRAGETVPISRELCDILAEALALTEADAGYSLYAGPLCREWRNILYLEEPAEADPLRNPEEARRLALLTEALAKPESLSLTLSETEEGCAACLKVSPELTALLEEMELDAPLLDLNLLRDAFTLRLVAESLAAQGFVEGQLSSKSGLYVGLRKTEYGLDLYSPGEGEIVAPARLQVQGPAAMVGFTALQTGGSPYGKAEVDGHLRHLWVNHRTGLPGEILLSAVLASGEEDIVTLTALALRLISADSREALAEAASGTTAAIALITADAPQLILVSENAALLADPDNASVKPLSAVN